MTSLPTNLQNLVGSYTDANVYTQQVTASNQLTRNQLIIDELTGISLDQIVRFKLATQLAENFLRKKPIIIEPRRNVSDIKYKPDLDSVVSVFMNLLDFFSYDSMMDHPGIQDEIEPSLLEILKRKASLADIQFCRSDLPVP